MKDGLLSRYAPKNIEKMLENEGDLLYKFNPNHDDHGRFADGSGGDSAPRHDPLVGVDGQPLSAAEQSIPNAADDAKTPHFLEQNESTSMGTSGWETDNPDLKLSKDVNGIPMIRGAGVLHDNGGLELQNYNDARSNIAVALGDAKTQIANAERARSSLARDSYDQSLDPATDLPHSAVALNYLDNAISDVSAHYKGAPANHPVAVALADYNVVTNDLVMSQPTSMQAGESPNTPAEEVNFEHYAKLYDRALADVKTAYGPMEALVKTVGREQAASGRYATKHFTPTVRTTVRR